MTDDDDDADYEFDTDVETPKDNSEVFQVRYASAQGPIPLEVAYAWTCARCSTRNYIEPTVVPLPPNAYALRCLGLGIVSLDSPKVPEGVFTLAPDRVVCSHCRFTASCFVGATRPGADPDQDIAIDDSEDPDDGPADDDDEPCDVDACQGHSSLPLSGATGVFADKPLKPETTKKPKDKPVDGDASDVSRN